MATTNGVLDRRVGHHMVAVALARIGDLSVVKAVVSSRARRSLGGYLEVMADWV